MPDVALRAVHAAFVAAFLLSATVQLNDPDPMRWIAVYAAAAVSSALGAAARPNVALSAVLLVVALAVAASLAGPFVACLAPGRTCFSSWDMHDDPVAEAAREAGGLGIVAIAAAIAVFDARRRSRRPAAAT